MILDLFSAKNDQRSISKDPNLAKLWMDQETRFIPLILSAYNTYDHWRFDTLIIINTRHSHALNRWGGEIRFTFWKLCDGLLFLLEQSFLYSTWEFIPTWDSHPLWDHFGDALNPASAHSIRPLMNDWKKSWVHEGIFETFLKEKCTRGVMTQTPESESESDFHHC